MNTAVLRCDFTNIITAIIYFMPNFKNGFVWKVGSDNQLVRLRHNHV